MFRRIPGVLGFIAVMVFFSTGSISAQQNPFLSSGPAETGSSVQKASDIDSSASAGTGPFFNSALMRKSRSIQKSIQAKISDYISDYRENGNIRTLIVFLQFSFLYGLLHVLGPGHRKVFLFTYFISRPSRWKAGMFAGFMTAVLHAVSAVVLIGGLFLVTSRALLTRFNNVTPVIETASYGAIVVIGLYLLVRQIISAASSHSNSRDSDSLNGRNPDTAVFIIVSGLVPCPGAAMIMIFSIAVGEPVVGIYAVTAMSLGMAAVLTLVPPAAIFLKNRLEPLLIKWTPETGERIHNGISIAGAVVMVLFGLLFLI